MQPNQFTCPTCRTLLRTAQTPRPGMMLRCTKCSTTFPVPAAAPAPPPPIADAIIVRPAPMPAAAPVPAPGPGPSISLADRIKKTSNRTLGLVIGGVALVLLVTMVLFLTVAVFAWKYMAGPAPVASVGTSKTTAPTPVVLAGPGGKGSLAKKSDWLKRTMVDAYDRQGSKNSKWDADARTVMALSIKGWEPHIYLSDAESEQYRAALQRLSRAGCNDAIVAYAVSRASARPEVFAVDRSASLLEKSAYHPVHRATGMVRITTLHQNPDEQQRYLDKSLKLLPEAVADKDVPLTFLVELTEQMEEGYRALLGNREQAHEKVRAVLAQAAPNSSLLATFEGKYQIKAAWDARGGGFANTVTPDGWRKFRQHLAEAETQLDTAWKLDNNNADAATAMLTVELGQGKGKVRMEEWFQRAMKADPDNFQACTSKLYYLEPKWHGSPEEMLAFGRECVKGGNWNVRIPFVLTEAHSRLAGYQRDNPQAYYQRPGVWDDIRSVYDPFLKTNPGALHERSLYAVMAVSCNQWDEANRQFQVMGDKSDGEIFQNPEQFRMLKAVAAQKAKKGP